MTVEFQSNDDIFGEEFQDEYYDELKYEVLSRSPEENVEVALEYMDIHWHRHGDESRIQVEMILTLLLDLAKQVPATYKIEGSVVKWVELGPTLDLDKFQEGYKRISGELFTAQEQEDDISNFISALEKMPHATIKENVLGGVDRQAVRDIFTPIFGETVNGEDLAFELRKHLERSFI